MKSSIVLIMFATATLLACGKTDEVAAPAPATEAPHVAEPAPAGTSVTTEPAAEPAAEPATPQAAAKPVSAPAAKPVPPPTAKPAPATPAPPKSEAAPAAPKPDLARGEQIYRQSCAVCHDKGVAGAPKPGDAATWSPRLARGMDAMYATALNGKGAMPAKGGNPALSETDVKAAVDYLAAQSR